MSTALKAWRLGDIKGIYSCHSPWRAGPAWYLSLWYLHPRALAIALVPLQPSAQSLYLQPCLYLTSAEATMDKASSGFFIGLEQSEGWPHVKDEGHHPVPSSNKRGWPMAGLEESS